MIRLQKQVDVSPSKNQALCVVTRGWVGGRRGRGGWGGGVGREGGGKNPQVKTRGDQSPTDGPDHTTRPKGNHSGQG